MTYPYMFSPLTGKAIFPVLLDCHKIGLELTVTHLGNSHDT
jgi:hypothetical protein